MKTKAIKWLSDQIRDDTCKADIDIIEFCKKCVREMKEAEEMPKVDWKPYFETLWKLYPRKVGKQNALKVFEHKVRGLTEEECRTKCNLIYKAQKIYTDEIERKGTEMEFVKHYSSWLNSEVPNSKHYKGR